MIRNSLSPMCILWRYHDASTPLACAVVSLHLLRAACLSCASSTRRAGSRIRAVSLCSQIHDRNSSLSGTP
ncbi:hypothetical protein BDA96_08G104100 [Sorghum bicolor]|uniref:Uncharacterized protein n=1 Tax=Sorghum bicolor TaxID=4558 RepID=A0A921QEH6_SORBI|nr:hypothetical protein BDA96_08G104100 [Sorghum bicolor]